MWGAHSGLAMWTSRISGWDFAEHCYDILILLSQISERPIFFTTLPTLPYLLPSQPGTPKTFYSQSTMSAPELASEALAAWDGIAPYWDEGIGKDGNKYWSVLQEPCLARLFQSTLDKFKSAPGSAPCRALDLATGNGLCARWLAARGAKVVATDGSEAMVEIAKGRSVGVKGVEFRKLDVTSDTDFEALVNVEEGGRGFNIVLMNMAIMDVADIEPLARALPKLLAKDGV